MPELFYRFTSWFDTFNKRLLIGVIAGASAGLILIALFFHSFIVSLLRCLQQPGELCDSIVYFGVSLMSCNLHYITALVVFLSSVIVGAYLLCNPLGTLRNEITKNILLPAFCFMVIFIGIAKFTALSLTLINAGLIVIISVCLAVVLTMLRGDARYVYYDSLITMALISGFLLFCAYSF
ncbi:MAG: hypothetical protein AB1485_04170 [Candidatus Thermoplasmatota archaeon]